jgi:NAD(P)-dependent dehydrogenase (short-subunit alcohol dehydrogenase family)
MAEQGTRTVLVTGAAGDIGAAIAEALLDSGARVHLTDVNARRLADRAAALEALGQVTWDACDLTDADAVVSMAGAALDRLGQIDVLVNNAGIQPEGGIEDCPPEDLERAFAVNVRAAYLLARALVPSMRAAGGGSIVNITSVHATAPGPRRLAYATTKTALLGLTRSLAVDLGPYNIRVNAVSPGATTTAQLREVWGRRGDVMAMAERQHPMRRIAEVGEVAEAVVFAADATFVTGTEIRVDGGLLSSLRLLPEV